jgi:hypothetical protein
MEIATGVFGLTPTPNPSLKGEGDSSALLFETNK